MPCVFFFIFYGSKLSLGVIGICRLCSLCIRRFLIALTMFCSIFSWFAISFVGMNFSSP